MIHEAVNSTIVSSMGYDHLKKILEVKFKTGATYQYEDVPLTIYQQLRIAKDSFGSLFDKLVKKGGSQYHKL